MTQENPPPTTKNVALGCVGCLAILLLVGIGIWVVLPETDPVGATDARTDAARTADAKERHETGMAYIQCQKFTEERLKSPKSADWPLLDVKTIKIAEHTYMVQSHVDSQNAFGAVIRTQVDCVVRLQDDTWILDAIDLN